MGHVVTQDRTPGIDTPQGGTWLDPERSGIGADTLTSLARAAGAYARHETDRAARREYYRLAMRYTRQAIKVASSSGHRRQYAAWYRDYFFLHLWDRPYLFSTLPANV